MDSVTSWSIIKTIYEIHSRLQWHPLLEPSIPTLSSNTACPRETQLLMERKRLSTWGITEYELHKKSGRIIFPAIGTLYQCMDTGYSVSSFVMLDRFRWKISNSISYQQPSPLFPSELRVCQLWTAIDPQICPHNSDLTAVSKSFYFIFLMENVKFNVKFKSLILKYVCGGDLWVTHAFSGHGERLTFAHDGRRTSFADDPLSAGVPSYVMQEEFNRYQGYWWQPNKSEGKKKCLLLFFIY